MGVFLSVGGIISGDNTCGGSIPLLTFCWMRYIASANWSLLSFPICLVSAKALVKKQIILINKETTLLYQKVWNKKSICKFLLIQPHHSLFTAVKKLHRAISTRHIGLNRRTLCWQNLQNTRTAKNNHRSVWSTPLSQDSPARIYFSLDFPYSPHHNPATGQTNEADGFFFFWVVLVLRLRFWMDQQPSQTSEMQKYSY